MTSFKLKLKRLVTIIIFRPLGLCRLRTIKYRSKERKPNDTRGQSLALDDWVLVREPAFDELPEKQKKSFFKRNSFLI